MTPKPVLVDRLAAGLKKKQSVKITFVDDNIDSITDFATTRKRKHFDEDDSFECDPKKLRRGVLSAMDSQAHIIDMM